MKEFLDLNKKIALKLLIWLIAIFGGGFSIYLFFFHDEISIDGILIGYFVALFLIPFFLLSVLTYDWFDKRKKENKILQLNPYSEIDKIGFSKKRFRNKHDFFVCNYVAIINDFVIIFDVDIKKPEIAVFRIKGYFKEISFSDGRRLSKEFASKNIIISASFFERRINTKKEKINSIQELEQILIDFTDSVKNVGYEINLLTDLPPSC